MLMLVKQMHLLIFLILHGTRESTLGFKVVILRRKEGQIAFDVS